MIKKIELAKNCNFYLIKTKKFKANFLQIFFKDKFKIEDLPYFSLVGMILNSANKYNPSLSEFNKYKENLYGLSTYTHTSMMADVHVFSVATRALNSSFIDDKEDLLLSQFITLNHILYNPYADENKFNEALFNERRSSLFARHKSMLDNNNIYARLQAKKMLGEDTIFGANSFGELNQINTLDNEKTFKIYKQMINRPFDLYLIGDFDETSAIELAKKYMVFKDYDEVEVKSILIDDNAIETKTEKQQINQSVLEIFYSLNYDYMENIEAATLFNNIFGGLSSSKLFKVIREKHGFCYSVDSSVVISQGILRIGCGISSKNKEKVLKLIEELLDEMKQGNISDEEMLMAKKITINDSLIRQDDQSELVDELFTQHCGFNNENFVKRIEKVTKNDLKEIASKVKFKTYFFLDGVSSENEND